MPRMKIRAMRRRTWQVRGMDQDADYLIRPVHDEDSTALIELIGACWSEYPGCVLDVDAEELWLRAPARAYREWAGAFWVVESGGVVACVGLKSHDGAVVELKSLYVARQDRRRGLGARLVGLVEMAAWRRGAALVQLWSDTRFTDAHRLYERLGYRRTGRTHDLHDLSASTEYQFTKIAPQDK
jgi:putative acetyltransferase